MFPRHTVALALLSFDSSDPQEAAAVTKLAPELVRNAAQQGYVSYRSHVALMDLIAEQFGFNDHALRRLTETVKDALDPHGVLSPGKQGIWPSRFRETPASLIRDH